MTEKQTKTIASVGLFTGGLFGMIGCFVSSSAFRGLSWGLDGVALIVACALLTVYYFKKGNDTIAAGFLVFSIGEGLILSGNTANLNENVQSFCAGTGLWAASLVLISLPKFFPLLLRVTGLIAAALFIVMSVQIYMGNSINGLSKPLPFYAYPFFAATIFGWGWMLLRKTV